MLPLYPARTTSGRHFVRAAWGRGDVGRVGVSAYLRTTLPWISINRNSPVAFVHSHSPRPHVPTSDQRRKVLGFFIPLFLRRSGDHGSPWARKAPNPGGQGK